MRRQNTHQRRVVTSGVLLVLVLASCRDPGISTVTSPLRVDTQGVDFGVAALGQTLAKAINVENDGKTTVDVTWSDLSGTPFTLKTATRFTPLYVTSAIFSGL